MRFFCISIYCVYVVSLHTESTDSVMTSGGRRGGGADNHKIHWVNRVVSSVWSLDVSVERSNLSQMYDELIHC